MSAPLSLPDALAQRLRATLVAATFGDTYDPVAQAGTPKFFADYAGEAAEPYLWIDEMGETYTYMTAGPGGKPYLAEGQLTITIMAVTRPVARQLGIQVAAALNDCDQFGVQWTGPGPTPSCLRLFRVMSASFQPITPVGPGIPAVFARVLTCQYEYQGAL